MFFLFILSIIIILLVAICTSKIGIEVKNLKIDTGNVKKINDERKIYVYLVIFNKIKLLKRDIKNLKISKKNIDKKIIKNKNLKIDYKDIIKYIDIEIAQIDLTVQIGTENAGTTAILVGTVSAILGNLIKKPKYHIIPIYYNRNLLKIQLEGIFIINLRQYIYNQIIKKRRREKRYERTSDRKSYANCYE